MIISLDRTSGLFNEQICDRTNHRSMQLYEAIQDLDVPIKAFKERVQPFKINTTYDIEQHCYSIGRTRIISFTLNSDIKYSDNNFILIGEVPFFAIANVMFQTDKAIYKINQNKLYVYPFSDGTKGDHVYTYYIS